MPPVIDRPTPTVARAESQRRLSLAECRELLGPEVELADHELERLRDHLYALAEATFDASSHLRSRLNQRAS